MTRPRRFYLAACLAAALSLIWAKGAAAENQDAVPISLQEAIERALKQHPAVKASEFQIQASEARNDAARAGLFPQARITGSANRTNSPLWAFGTRLNQGRITQADFDPAKLNDPEDINNFSSAVSVDWTLYDGNRTRSGIVQSEAGIVSGRLDLQRTRQQIIAGVATAYAGLLLAEANLDLVRRTLDTAEAHLEMVRSRFANGFVVKSDLLRARVRVAEMTQKRFQAESGVLSARSALNTAMGDTEDTPRKLTTSLQAVSGPEDSREAWEALALTERPDLRQWVQRESMARAEIDKAQAGHLPELHLVGSYEINSESFEEAADNYTVGALLQFNLFSGGRTTAAVQEAGAKWMAVRAARESAALRVADETRRAFLDAESAWNRIRVAESAIDQAEEGLHIVEDRYRNGLFTIVNLLDAEVALQEARTLHIESLHDYFVARVRLALASGTLSENFQ